MNINLLKNRNKNFTIYTNNNKSSSNFNCEEYFQNMIKYNKKSINLNTDILYCLYIAIAYKTKNNDIYNDVCQSYKLHKKYINELNDYIIMIDNYDFRKYVYNILLTYNNNIDIDNNLFNFISKYYDIKKIIDYNLSVNEFKNNTFLSINKLLLICDNYEKEILNELINKINNNYKTIHKFTNPEIMIYNQLINNDKILYVFNHFTLPVFRIKKHPLYADFLLLFNINNKLIFAIIEYDGPTHYNNNDFRFKKENVDCDMIKNKFCLDNKINILRINTINDNIINDFIINIYNGLHQVIIPNNEYYLNILK
jgi:hypothetical protein